MKVEKMTEHEKQIEISICKACLKYLKKPHWSWDILFRPLRIFYFSRKLKKLHQAQVKQWAIISGIGGNNNEERKKDEWVQ